MVFLCMFVSPYILNRDRYCGVIFLDLDCFPRFKYSWPADLDDSLHLEILKEALLRAIHDIDVTFSKASSV